MRKPRLGTPWETVFPFSKLCVQCLPAVGLHWGGWKQSRKKKNEVHHVESSLLRHLAEAHTWALSQRSPDCRLRDHACPQCWWDELNSMPGLCQGQTSTTQVVAGLVPRSGYPRVLRPAGGGGGLNRGERVALCQSPGSILLRSCVTSGK